MVFTADHGDFMGDHDMMLKGPIHYDSLIGVPLVVRGPGFEPGRRVTAPVGTIDLVPTFCQLAGVEVGPEVEGRSLLGPDHELAITEDDTADGIFELRTITTGRHRLSVNLADGAGELYDHHDDPGEHRNRWDDPGMGPVQADLLDALHAHRNHVIRRQLRQVSAAG